MVAKAVLVVLCLTRTMRLGEAERTADDSENLALGLDSEGEEGVVYANTSASLQIKCRAEIIALEKSVGERVQLQPGSVANLVDKMLGMRDKVNSMYGIPTNLVGHEGCKGIVSNVFKEVETGWWHVEVWKGQCNFKNSCFTKGLKEVGLTADYLRDQDWEGSADHFGLVVHQYDQTCQASCDYLPDCKQCMDRVKNTKCLLYGGQSDCRTRLQTAVLCHCAESFLAWLDSKSYAKTLERAAESVKDTLERGSDDNSVTNKECKKASSDKAAAKALKGTDETVFAKGHVLYIKDRGQSLEGAVCAPGYSCQWSRVWKSPTVGALMAPVLVAGTYLFMKVMELTTVKSLSMMLCGPAWLACWTTYATSIPASEVAIAGVVAISRRIMGKDALACLPTRCREMNGTCEVPGPDPQDWRALIPGVRCSKPASEAERRDLEAEAGTGGERKCRLEFCPHGVHGNGPQEDGALWHCSTQSDMDPQSSLVAKAKRFQQQMANTCEDDGVDIDARKWFVEELSKYRSGGSGCIQEAMKHWFSEDFILELDKDDSTMYALFEAARKQRGYICTKGCPDVPPYLVDKGCMTAKMNPKVFMRGLWKKAAQGPLDGCKKAFMMTFLCECVAVYAQPVSSHRLFSGASDGTLYKASQEFEHFLSSQAEAADRNPSLTS